MSREPKERGKAAPKVERFNNVKFVNWALDDAQKTACKAWELARDDFDDLLVKTIEAGYKVTLSYDGFRSAYTASLVAQQEAKTNYGFILAGKGSTPLKALKQALYIHYYVMAEDWSAYSTQGTFEEFDD
jgi:hypothetical protein